MPTTAAPPTGSPVSEVRIDPVSGLPRFAGMMTRDWVQWFFALVSRLDQTTAVLGSASIPATAGLNAAIPLTALPLPSLTEGLYRVSYNLRLTAPADTSSQLQMLIAWTDPSSGLTRTYNGRNMTDNSVASAMDAGSVLAMVADATPISYGTNYASVAAGAMTYALDVSVEAVQT